MQTTLTLLGVICRFSFFAGAPVLLLIALNWAQWRPYFRGELLSFGKVTTRWTLHQLWAGCYTSMLLGSAIMMLHKFNKVAVLDWYLRPYEPTWWITSIGQMIFGLSVWFFLLARRRVPSLRVGDRVVEFFRLNATVVEVHVQRKSLVLLHFLAPCAEGFEAIDASTLEHQKPLLVALDVALRTSTLASLERIGVERVEVFSPLITDIFKRRLKRELGQDIHGYAVTHTTTRMRKVESFSLLFMRPLTTWKWLRKRVVWIKDKAVLNDRIPLKNWYRPVMNGFVIEMKQLEK